MGMFLSLSGIIGRNQEEVTGALVNYTWETGGGLEPQTSGRGHKNRCVVQEANGNTTVAYPDDFTSWDDASAFLSKELQAPAFSLHIHDGDLWMYVLYVNGEVVDRFNPVPDYWEDNLSEADMDSWKGNAGTVAQYVPGLDPVAIEKYLIRWGFTADPNNKAYPDDKHDDEDWQLLDFMRKIGLPYPFTEDGEPSGNVYQFWTKDMPLVTK